MKRLTAQVMCHPLVAIAALFAADLLMRSDSGLSGAMYVVAAKSVSRLFNAMRRGATRCPPDWSDLSICMGKVKKLKSD
jgi:hypothetical protein